MEKHNLVSKYFTNIKSLFFIYLIILLMVNLLFDGIHTRVEHRTFSWYNEVPHNIIPLSSISNYITNLTQYNFDTWFYNTLGNIILFIPLGCLLPIVHDNFKVLKQVIMASFLISLFTEGIQYVTSLGVFDIDDIILNTAGGIIGFIIFTLDKTIIKQRGSHY